MAFTAKLTDVRKVTNGLEVRVTYSDGPEEFQRDYSLSGDETKAEVIALVRREVRRLNKLSPLAALLTTDVTARTVIGE